MDPSRAYERLEPNGVPYLVLQTQAPGYVLAVEPETLDRCRFQGLAADGRAALEAGEPARAARLLREALELWRGPALADLAHTLADRTELDGLEDERLGALEDRIDADLALARHGRLVSELEPLVARHPHRERLRGQLMLALYRCGRQAEALDAYREGRRLLDEDLGLSPGPALRELERRILGHDPDLTAPQPSVHRSPLPGRMRRNRLAIAFGGGLTLLLLAAAAAFALSTTRGESTPDRVEPNGLGMIDPSSNTLVRSIAVGSYPEDVAVGEGSVWVANAGDHTVSRVDPRAGRVVTTKGLTGAPVTLDVSHGAVWIAMSHLDQPTSILRLSRTPNEAASHVVELTPELGLLWPVFATGRSGLWTSLSAEPDTVVLTAFREHRLDLLPPGCVPVGSGIANATVWIGCSDGRLVRVNERTRKRLQITRVGSFVTGLAVGAGSVWMTDSIENVVWRIDAISGRPTRTIRVGKSPAALAFGFGAVWVANRNSGTVSRIDPRRNRVVAVIRVGRDVDDVAVGEGKVWVTVPGAIADHD